MFRADRPGTQLRPKAGFQTMTEDARTAKSGTNGVMTNEDEEKVSLETLEITMDKRVDLAVAVATALLGAFILIESRDIRLGTVTDPITSRGMATITGTFLLIAGIVLAIRQLLTWSVLPGHLVPEEGQEDEKGHPASWTRAFSIILVSALWERLLEPVGFLFVTPLFLFVASWFMGVRSKGKLIAFPLIFTLVTWVCFDPVMGVRIPLGPLEPLARSFGIIP